jgi:hypothetical protein
MSSAYVTPSNPIHASVEFAGATGAETSGTNLNVALVTRTGPGVYEVDFPAPAATANGVAGCLSPSVVLLGSTPGLSYGCEMASTTKCIISVEDETGAPSDAADVHFTLFKKTIGAPRS